VGKRLVTIVTFDQAAQAELAKNELEEEGVRAIVTDATIVTMDWLLSNAVGGVKVQVWEEDAEKAVAVLRKKFGDNGEEFGTPVSAEELAAAAEGATPEEGEEPEPERQPTTPSATASPEIATDESAAKPSERDDYARRAVFTALLGDVLIPAWSYLPIMTIPCIFILFYALFLILNGGWGEGVLSSRGRFNMIIAGSLTLANLGWLFFYLRFLALS
jgi:hypothetical protein